MSGDNDGGCCRRSEDGAGEATSHERSSKVYAYGGVRIEIDTVTSTERYRTGSPKYSFKRDRIKSKVCTKERIGPRVAYKENEGEVLVKSVGVWKTTVNDRSQIVQAHLCRIPVDQKGIRKLWNSYPLRS